MSLSHFSRIHGKDYPVDLKLSERELLLRQVQIFIVFPPSKYVKCLMCGEFDAADWLFSGMPLDLAKHCAAHANGFHALLPLQPLCCDPLYHPLNDYPWRKFHFLNKYE